MEGREAGAPDKHPSSAAREVAHDLNNLLNTLGMVVHEAADASRTPAEIRSALSEIRSLLDQGEAIVDRIRGLSLDPGSSEGEGPGGET